MWFRNGEPLCLLWLLTEKDNPALRKFPEWADLYPPLPAGCDQLEHVWTFSNVRRQGVATRFGRAVMDEARRRGLRHLAMQITQNNTASRRWAEKIGWTPYRTITRYELDFPGWRNRDLSVSVHRRGAVPPIPDAT